MKNKDIKVIGAMLVSQHASMLDITIPNLLKYSDWILIMMDNETKEVEERVYEYQRKYYDKIFVRRSTVPMQIIDRKGNAISYRQRSKSMKGVFRDDVFVTLRRILSMKKEGYDKIDILLWPDSDEIFTKYLPELLDTFWESKYKAISTRPVDVVGNMRTVKADGMGHHVHILKYHDNYSAFPWTQYALYHPLGRTEALKAAYYSVHLAFLTEDIREWRHKNWKSYNIETSDLWKLEKDVEDMSPEEITNIFKKEPDIKI